MSAPQPVAVDARWHVHLGDCVAWLLSLPEASVDAIVCDPPYGLGFMGKAWDALPPGKAWAEACLRALKPGGHLVAFGATRTIHRLVCAVEDAGFEVRDQVGWVFFCVDADTQCLTRNGWRFHNQLTDGDEIAAWDPETGAICWEAATFNVQPYSGAMVRIHGKFTDQHLTPNHRVVGSFARRRKDREVGVMTAGDLLAAPATVATLPTAGILKGGQGGPGVESAYLLGWWLTDAWAHKDGKACMFSQCKPDTLAKLKAALGPHKHSEYIKAPKKDTHSPEHTFYVTGPIAQWLRSEWPDREIRWEALGWSQEDRVALLEGLLDGDGSRHANGWTFWSKRPERRSIFMALAASLGFRVQEAAEKGAVYGNVDPEICIRGRHRESVDYTGMVWCPRVRTGAWLARRGAYVFITGNSGFPKSLDVSKAIDAAAGADRVRRLVPTKTGNVARMGLGLQGVTYGDAHGGFTDQSDPATPEAAQWAGFGTALKPAYEPAILARKALVGTVAQNVLRYGTGALNIDGCRFAPGDPAWVGPNEGHTSQHGRSAGASAGCPVYSGDLRAVEPGQTDGQRLGRFPANLYHAPKASRSERERGCDGLPVRTGAEAVDREEGSAGTHSPRAGAGRTAANVRNHHPTVKSVQLMRWLCRLVTPPGGLVVDPFTGSGSTGIAALLEGFRFAGAEMEPDYHQIACARIAHAALHPEEWGGKRKAKKRPKPPAEVPAAQALLFGGRK